MGIFNRNENEELLLILGEIRDNLKINNDEIVTSLESKIADAHYSNDEEVGVLTSKLTSIEKLVDLHEKSIANLENIVEKQDKEIGILKNVVCRQIDILKELINRENPPEVVDNAGVSLKRYYSSNIINSTPNIINLQKDGYFKLKKGVSKYNIETVLLLQQLIDKDISFKQISEKVNLDQKTCKSLCYMIETGQFDKYFNEWVQISANKFYSKAKKQVRSENNKKGRF